MFAALTTQQGLDMLVVHQTKKERLTTSALKELCRRAIALCANAQTKRTVRGRMERLVHHAKPVIMITLANQVTVYANSLLLALLGQRALESEEHQETTVATELTL
jgi:hypothetical protein